MAARKQVNISEEQYLEVIGLLEDGGTKKRACEILGISYNTKRLDNLIAEFHERKERDKALRAKKRKIAVDTKELVEIITDYLNGFTLQDLSERYYRSADIIKYHLEKNGALLRQHSKIDPLNPPLLPDKCIADEFEVGQYVWSSKYGAIAEVVGFYKNAYRIQVFGNNVQEFSYQPAYELGSLKHLEELGVNLKAFEDYTSWDEIKAAIIKARQASRRQK